MASNGTNTPANGAAALSSSANKRVQRLEDWVPSFNDGDQESWLNGEATAGVIENMLTLIVGVPISDEARIRLTKQLRIFSPNFYARVHDLGYPWVGMDYGKYQFLKAVYLSSHKAEEFHALTFAVPVNRPENVDLGYAEWLRRQHPDFYEANKRRIPTGKPQLVIKRATHAAPAFNVADPAPLTPAVPKAVATTTNPPPPAVPDPGNQSSTSASSAFNAEGPQGDERKFLVTDPQTNTYQDVMDNYDSLCETEWQDAKNGSNISSDILDMGYASFCGATDLGSFPFFNDGDGPIEFQAAEDLGDFSNVMGSLAIGGSETFHAPGDIGSFPLFNDGDEPNEFQAAEDLGDFSNVMGSLVIGEPETFHASGDIGSFEASGDSRV